MRIRHIKIDRWRHFSNIELSLPDDAGLVCIVGANGTGKSHLLELIAVCAHRLGLAQGIEIPRGDPFNDEHEFSLTFYVAEGVSDAVDKDLMSDEAFKDWNRKLCIKSQKCDAANTTVITAGGITDATQAKAIAQRVVEKLQASKSVHFISLDADRAYPKKNIQIHEIAQAYEIDWEGSEYKRGRSFKSTATLYDEWIKYLLAQENQAGTALIKNIRNAREASQPEPTFADHFLDYKDALRQVLPHVIFAGIEPKARKILFNTTGLELSFDQLSGGEREIAFLVGQIDRFGLRQGLFLLDEPELHLNADLIRVWVGYLTSTVKTGQVWLATHSLEAVEAAGQQATFVLERNDETRRVDSLMRLDQRPVLSALSRSVGTPAFSISKLLFVFVEGEESVGERERFRRLAGLPQDVRFMECGSCNEVIRRVGTIKALANESETGIRIGGIVDRDFRSTAEVSAFQQGGIFTLPVHEVENYFLHPPTLDRLLEQNGRSQKNALALVQQAADARAGSWVFQYAMNVPNAKTLPEIASAAKEIAKGLSWTNFDATAREATIQRIVKVSSFDETNQEKLAKLLGIAVGAYERRRIDADLWKTCEGKQVLNDVSRDSGFADASALSQAAFAAWEKDGGLVPSELGELRQYLKEL